MGTTREQRSYPAVRTPPAAVAAGAATAVGAGGTPTAGDAAAASDAVGNASTESVDATVADATVADAAAAAVQSAGYTGTVGAARGEDGRGASRAPRGVFLKAEEERRGIRTRSMVLRKGRNATGGDAAEEKNKRDEESCGVVRGRSLARGVGDGKGEFVEKRRRVYSMPRRGHNRISHGQAAERGEKEEEEEEARAAVGAAREKEEGDEERKRSSGEPRRGGERGEHLAGRGRAAELGTINSRIMMKTAKAAEANIMMMTGKARCSAVSFSNTDARREDAGGRGGVGESYGEDTREGGAGGVAAAEMPAKEATTEGSEDGDSQVKKGRYLTVETPPVRGRGEGRVTGREGGERGRGGTITPGGGRGRGGRGSGVFSLMRSPRSIFVTGEHSPREKPPSPPIYRSRYSSRMREDDKTKANRTSIGGRSCSSGCTSISSNSGGGVGSSTDAHQQLQQQDNRHVEKEKTLAGEGTEKAGIFSVGLKESSTMELPSLCESVSAANRAGGREGETRASDTGGTAGTGVRCRGTLTQEQVQRFVSKREAAELEKKLQLRASKERKRRRGARRRRRAANHAATDAAGDDAGERGIKETAAAAATTREGAAGEERGETREEVVDDTGKAAVEGGDGGESVATAKEAGGERRKRRSSGLASPGEMSQSSSGTERESDSSGEEDDESEVEEKIRKNKSVVFEEVLREIQSKARTAAAAYALGETRSRSADDTTARKRLVQLQGSCGSLTEIEEDVSGGAAAELEDMRDHSRDAAFIRPTASAAAALHSSRRSTAQRLRDGLLPRPATVYQEAWKTVDLGGGAAPRGHFLQKLETTGWMRRLTERDEDGRRGDQQRRPLIRSRSTWALNERGRRKRLVQVKQGTRIKGKIKAQSMQQLLLQQQQQQRKHEQEQLGKPQQQQQEDHEEEQHWVINRVRVLSPDEMSVLQGKQQSEREVDKSIAASEQQSKEDEEDYFSPESESSFWAAVSRARQQRGRQKKQQKKYLTEKRGRSLGRTAPLSLPVCREDSAAPILAAPRRKQREKRGHQIYPQSCTKKTLSRYITDIASFAYAKSRSRYFYGGRERGREWRQAEEEQPQLRQEDMWESSTPEESSAEEGDEEDLFAPALAGDMRATEAAAAAEGTGVAGRGGGQQRQRTRKSPVQRVLTLRPYRAFNALFDTRRSKRSEEAGGKEQQQQHQELLGEKTEKNGEDTNQEGQEEEEEYQAKKSSVTIGMSSMCMTLTSDSQSVQNPGEFLTAAGAAEAEKAREEEGGDKEEKEIATGQGEIRVLVVGSSSGVDDDGSVSQQNVSAGSVSSPSVLCVSVSAAEEEEEGEKEASQQEGGAEEEQPDREKEAAMSTNERNKASSSLSGMAVCPTKSSASSFSRNTSLRLEKIGLSSGPTFAAVANGDRLKVPSAASVALSHPEVARTRTTTTALSNATGTTVCTASGAWNIWPLSSSKSIRDTERQQQQYQHKTIHGGQTHRKPMGFGRCVPDVPKSCPVARALLDSLLLAQRNLVMAQSQATQLTHAKIKRLLACQRLLQRQRATTAGSVSVFRWMEMREQDERRDLAEEDFDAPLSSFARQQLLLHAFLQLVRMQVRLADDGGTIDLESEKMTHVEATDSAFSERNFLTLVRNWVNQENKENSKGGKQRVKLMKTGTSNTLLTCRTLSFGTMKSLRVDTALKAAVEKTQPGTDAAAEPEATETETAGDVKEKSPEAAGRGESRSAETPRAVTTAGGEGRYEVGKGNLPRKKRRNKPTSLAESEVHPLASNKSGNELASAASETAESRARAAGRERLGAEEKENEAGEGGRVGEAGAETDGKQWHMMRSSTGRQVTMLPDISSTIEGEGGGGVTAQLIVEEESRRGANSSNLYGEIERRRDTMLQEEQRLAHRNLIKDVGQMFSTYFRSRFGDRRDVRSGGEAATRGEKKKEEGEGRRRQRRLLWRRRRSLSRTKPTQGDNLSFGTTCASEGIAEAVREAEEEEEGLLLLQQQRQRQQQRRAEKLMRREFRRLIQMGQNTLDWPISEQQGSIDVAAAAAEEEEEEEGAAAAAAAPTDGGDSGVAQAETPTAAVPGEEGAAAEAAADEAGGGATAEAAQPQNVMKAHEVAEEQQRGRFFVEQMQRDDEETTVSGHAMRRDDDTYKEEEESAFVEDADSLKRIISPRKPHQTSSGNLISSWLEAIVQLLDVRPLEHQKKEPETPPCKGQTAPASQTGGREAAAAAAQMERRVDAAAAARTEGREAAADAGARTEGREAAAAAAAAGAEGGEGEEAADDDEGKSKLRNEEEERDKEKEDKKERDSGGVCAVDEEAIKGARVELARLLLQQRILLRKQAREALQMQQQEQEGQQHPEKGEPVELNSSSSRRGDDDGEGVAAGASEEEHEENKGSAAEGNKSTTMVAGENHHRDIIGSDVITMKDEALEAAAFPVASAVEGSALEAIRDEPTAASAFAAEDTDVASASAPRSAAAVGADTAVAAVSASHTSAAGAGDQVAAALEEADREEYLAGQPEVLQTPQSPASAKSWKYTWTEMTRRGYAALTGRTAIVQDGAAAEEEEEENKIEDYLLEGEWVYPPASIQYPLVMLQDVNFRFAQRRLEQEAKLQENRDGLFSFLKTLTLTSRARRRKREEFYKNFTLMCSPYPKPIDLPPRFFFLGRPAAEVIFVTSTLGVRKHTFFRCKRLAHFLACRAIVYYQIDANIDSSSATGGGGIADGRLLRRWKRQRILRNAPHTYNRGVLVPQLLVDGQSIGSYEEVMKLEDDGLFDALVSRGRCPTCLQPRHVGMIKCTACGSSFRELLSLRKQYEGQVIEMYRDRPTRSARVFSSGVDENTSWELYSGYCGACGSRREIDDPFCPRCHLATRDIAIAKVLGLGICRRSVCTQCGTAAGRVQDCLEPLPEEANPFAGKPLGRGFVTSRASPLCSACGCLLTYLHPVNQTLFGGNNLPEISGHETFADNGRDGLNSSNEKAMIEEKSHSGEQEKNRTLMKTMWQQREQQEQQPRQMVVVFSSRRGDEAEGKADDSQSTGNMVDDEDEKETSEISGTDSCRQERGGHRRRCEVREEASNREEPASSSTKDAEYEEEEQRRKQSYGCSFGTTAVDKTQKNEDTKKTRENEEEEEEREQQQQQKAKTRQDVLATSGNDPGGSPVPLV